MKGRETLGGKVAIITGAAGGIGEATGRIFAREGARIALVDLEPEVLTRLRDRIAYSAERPIADFIVIAADVAASDEVAGYVERVIAEFGGIDVLFNNAGIEGPVAAVHEYDEDRLDEVLRVNLKGVWLNLRHAAAAMLARGGGSIVNTASGAALRGMRHLSGYTASKHGVLGLTRAAALDLAGSNVRVNAVCPGPVDTRMMGSLERQHERLGTSAEEARRIFIEDVPMGRYGRPDEIGEVVAFLASDAASYMTGAAVTVDGGATAA